MPNIKVGISVSLSGSYLIQGRESYEGLSLWVSRVNEKGGLYVDDLNAKCTLRLIGLDDGSNIEKCRSNTERLITRERVDILLGPYSSSLALAAAEMAEYYKKPLWNHGASGSYMHTIIDLVRKTDLVASNITLFYARDSGFSRSIAEGARKRAAEKKFDVLEFGYKSGEQNLRPLIHEAVESTPDLILGMGRMEDDLVLAAQLTELGVRVKAVALIASSIKLFRDRFGPRADGYLSSSQWESGLNIKPDMGPSSLEFTRSYASAYGKEPDYTAAQAYNIGLVIERCIEQAGTLDDGALLDAARSLSFRTFYGDFRLDARGMQSGHRMLAVQWQDGRKRIVYPEDVAEAGFIYPM